MIRWGFDLWFACLTARHRDSTLASKPWTTVKDSQGNHNHGTTHFLQLGRTFCKFDTLKYYVKYIKIPCCSLKFIVTYCCHRSLRCKSTLVITCISASDSRACLHSAQLLSCRHSWNHLLASRTQRAVQWKPIENPCPQRRTLWTKLNKIDGRIAVRRTRTASSTSWRWLSVLRHAVPVPVTVSMYTGNRNFQHCR